MARVYNQSHLRRFLQLIEAAHHLVYAGQGLAALMIIRSLYETVANYVAVSKQLVDLIEATAPLQQIHDFIQARSAQLRAYPLPARGSDNALTGTPLGQEAEMAYERLNEALRQLKTDRERQEATEKQQLEAATEARMGFARIKSAVIEPIFNEVVALVTAEGFFGETVDQPNDGCASISLDVNLSEDEGSVRQGSLQVRFNPDQCTCEFGRSTMAKPKFLL